MKWHNKYAMQKSGWRSLARNIGTPVISTVQYHITTPCLPCYTISLHHVYHAIPYHYTMSTVLYHITTPCLPCYTISLHHVYRAIPYHYTMSTVLYHITTPCLPCYIISLHHVYRAIPYHYNMSTVLYNITTPYPPCYSISLDHNCPAEKHLSATIMTPTIRKKSCHQLMAGKEYHQVKNRESN